MKIDFNGTQFEFNEGDFVLIAGKSGSGKTTLLNQIEKTLKNEGRTTGFVFQNFDSQIVTDKVWHELSFGLENAGTEKNLMHRRVAEMASYFGITAWLEKDTDSLSGGQKQLLNLAGTMALLPDFLLLDEPVSQLDPVAAGNFLNTIKKLNRELGTTVILTEHRLEDIFADADKVVLLDEMKVFQEGSPRQVMKKLAESDKRDFLTTPALYALDLIEKSGEKIDFDKIPLTIGEGRRWICERVRGGSSAGGVDRNGAQRSEDDGASAELRTARPETKQGEVKGDAPVLKNISYKYSKNGPLVLEDLNLTIAAGKITGIVGANGSGKSTLLKVMAGEKPASGKVDSKNRRVAMMSQNVRNLFTKHTVAEELGLAAGGITSSVAEGLDFSKLSDRHPYDLSGGEMQKLALAKLLATKPDVLLLDEPTKGLDNCFKNELSSILKALASGGMTIVLVCHDLEFCSKTADFTGLMFKGQVTGLEETDRFFEGNCFYTTALDRMLRGTGAARETGANTPGAGSAGSSAVKTGGEL